MEGCPPARGHFYQTILVQRRVPRGLTRQSQLLGGLLHRGPASRLARPPLRFPETGEDSDLRPDENSVRPEFAD